MGRATTTPCPNLASPPTPDPAATALFLDIDGTLVEFAESVDQVAVTPGLLPLLEALCRRFDGALALISGRTIDSIDRLLSPLVLDAAGLHGAQWRLNGRRGALAAPPAAYAAVVRDLRRFADVHPGVRLEDKEGALALHTRLAPHLEAEALALVEAGRSRLGGAYRLQRGTAVAELVPVSATKGNGIARLMAAAPFAGRRPVFAGDDLTDESGFIAADNLGGFGVLVGSARDTAARHRLADVGAVHDWLKTIADGA